MSRTAQEDCPGWMSLVPLVRSIKRSRTLLLLRLFAELLNKSNICFLVLNYWEKYSIERENKRDRSSFFLLNKFSLLIAFES